MDQASTLRKIRNGDMKGVKVISVTSGKGGVGKTNVVANLAIALAKTGKKVLILDADMGLGNLDVLLGIAPMYNMNHVIRGEKTLKEIMVGGPYGIKILPASSGVQELTALTASQRMNLFLEVDKLEGEIDVMLIDTAAGISSDVLFFNIAAQEIIVVVSPEPTSMTDAYAIMKVLHTKHGENRFRLLVNSAKGVKESAEVYRKISLVAERFLNISIDYLGYIPYDENIQKAVREQRAIIDIYPDSKASKCFIELAKRVEEITTPSELKGNVQFFWQRLTEVMMGAR